MATLLSLAGELNRFWSKQPDGYRFLSYFDAPKKDGGVFKSITIPPGTSTEDGLAQLLDGDDDVHDIYFAPGVFSKDARQSQHSAGGRWLYADLDEVDPRSLDSMGVKPTVAWRTSPGRYQAAWLLDDHLAADKLESLNRAMTYFTGADSGGWSLTKVLRVPGTENFKRDEVAQVKRLWTNGPVYAAHELALGTLKETLAGIESGGTASKEKLKPSEKTAKQIWLEWGKKMPGPVKKLVLAKRVEGDRSKVLFKLECMLIEQGMPPAEVITLVRITVWNKWKGMRSEMAQLTRDVDRAVKQVGDRAGTGKTQKSASPVKTPEELAEAKRARAERRKRRQASLGDPKPTVGPKAKRSRRRQPKAIPTEDELEEQLEGKGFNPPISPFNLFMSQQLERPQWLVDSVWGRQAHGIIAGEPKSYKSLLALDLAMSVASGQPFLDQFQIPEKGDVLFIQEENDPGNMQTMAMNIGYSKGLFDASTVLESSETHNFGWANIGLNFVNNASFQITEDDHLEWLEDIVSAQRPQLVVLDPFYLMTGGVDENVASEVTVPLRKLLKLKQKFGTGILLIHHYRKAREGSAASGAARISGSGVFSRWFESAVYVERVKDEEHTVKLIPDHRAHANARPIKVKINMAGIDEDDPNNPEGDQTDPYYEPEVIEQTMDEDVLDEAMAWKKVIDKAIRGKGWTKWSQVRAKLKEATEEQITLMLNERGWAKHQMPRRGTASGGGLIIICPVGLAKELAQLDYDDGMKLLSAAEREAGEVTEQDMKNM